ncbi:MAG: LacI family DNA-binding transcriptional regulator [Hyphomicrobiales bacterium]|nr:LacI family DNA-binding transcriptional regulator [Hyphomicrobiales bacterium]
MGDNGRERVTIRSIARETGLSIATVSRALQESPSVRAETTHLVLDAAERLGYRRNPSGAGLRTGRTETICLVMQVATSELLGDVGALQIITGANQRLAGSGYNLNLVPVAPEEDPLDALKGVVRRGSFDGIVLSSTRPDDPRVGFLDSRGIPFVTFGRTDLPIEHAYYDVDNEDFVYRAASLLIARGCRRVGLFLPPRELAYSQHRVAGLRRALAQAGLSVERDGVLLADAELSLLADINTLIGNAEPVDGLICGREIAALAILSTLQNAGIVIGSDIHLVTMETSSLPDHFPVPVSGFFQDLHLTGAVLADFVLRRVAGAPPQSLQRVDTMTLRERG